MSNIKEQAALAVSELLAAAKLSKGDILVIGCSSSEVVGNKIGSSSNADAAEEIFDGIYPILREHGIFLAVQCCEHLNRAVIIEEETAKHYNLDTVNVVPHPHAGGAFATKAYNSFKKPVAVEKIRAHAGMDIGGTLIGMHLREVAVPVRISINKIGEASLILARTRAKFIGGERAHYNKDLL